MLRYHDCAWKLIPGSSRFEASIGGSVLRPGAVHWTFQLNYCAAGAEWRRCQIFNRPQLALTVSSFSVPSGDWRQLADANYWNVETDDFDAAAPRPGYLDLTFRDAGRTSGYKTYDLGGLNWRVIQAEKSQFTLELAAGAGAAPSTRESLVTATPGASDFSESAHACEQREVYLIETIPFGVVMVRVPRNAADPARHAETLARRALNTPLADHIEVWDFKDCGSEETRNDLHVKLHFHGIYDD